MEQTLLWQAKWKLLDLFFVFKSKNQSGIMSQVELKDLYSHQKSSWHETFLHLIRC